MSEYTEVEQPFLQQLAAQGWTVIDQGAGVPQAPAPSLRASFREWLLPQVFDTAVRALNVTADGRPWLTDSQLEDLHGQLLRQPNRTLLEANGFPLAVVECKKGSETCANPMHQAFDAAAEGMNAQQRESLPARWKSRTWDSAGHRARPRATFTFTGSA